MSVRFDLPRGLQLRARCFKSSWPVFACTVFLWVAIFASSYNAPKAYAKKIPPGEVTSEQVKNAISKAIAFIKRNQKPDGSYPATETRIDGVTALCALALLHAGVDKNDPAVEKAIAFLINDVNDNVYTASLKCQVFALADPVKYKKNLQASAKYLMGAQRKNGSWGYTASGTQSDNSNTQFAMLGLYEAGKAGVEIHPRIWRRSVKHYLRVQTRNGSWGYKGSTSKGYGSMTAAAIASLHIGGHSLNLTGKPHFENGRSDNCGKYSQHKKVAKGIEWMIKNFSVTTNPKSGAWYYYYMYALERTGMITGMRSIGKNDWYRMGAKMLVHKQKKDGSWNSLINTSFALLFLAKGNRPVLIQKLQWKGDWNRNNHDLENLTGFIGNSLGKPTTWQTASLDQSLKDLRQSPILFITGHDFPNFSDKEIDKLKKYVDQAGGTIIFEACCGSQAYQKKFKAFCKKAWPEQQLRKLQPDHPVFYCLHKLNKTYDLMGLGHGCRTGIFYSPNALSCLWELKNVPVHSEFAFKLGANICAYATGKDQLRSKLEIVQLPPAQAQKDKRVALVPRGAIQIARLIHTGDYNTDPYAMINLALLLKKTARIEVVARSKHVNPQDKSLYEYPVVFMTGHNNFTYTPAQIKALARYLKKGGFLMASNCCGRQYFDQSFRKMVAQLFPDAKFEKLPANHPIYTGKTGIDLGEVKYRPALAKMLNARGTKKPILEAVKYKGRTVIIYSKYDYCCGLEGDRPFSCKGYSDKSAHKLAMSIFLFGLNF